MTTQTLSDLVAGDAVAYQDYCSSIWQRQEILRTTDKYIILKNCPDMKFKKSDGQAIGGKKDIIRVASPEIQESWSKLFYKCKLQAWLLATENSEDTDEVIAQVFHLLASQNKWEQREYRTAIYDILFETQTLVERQS